MDKSYLLEWWYNKSKNPISKRKIKKNGRVWKKFLNQTLENNIINDPYHSYHNKFMDPLTTLKLDKNIKVYKYSFCWDPLNGNILSRDIRGPLIFDPDVLIHYFYTRRLNYLWIDSEDGYSGTYGDAVGNGPDFYVSGRGYSYHWYLFRLPLFNAYCSPEKIGQQTTMGPILSYNEVKKIYDLANKNKKNYLTLFNKERPDLLKIYNLYHQAIQKPILDNNIEYISNKEIKESYVIMNRLAVDNLKKF